MIKLLKAIVAGASFGLLFACGGGGDSTPSVAPPPTTSPPTTPPPPPPVDPAAPNPGGTPANPVTLSIEKPNKISADTFQNNFKITVGAGDTLVLRSNLVTTLSDIWFSRCSGGGSSDTYYTGIVVLDKDKSCSLDLKHTFTDAGEYTIKVGYPEGNSGQLDAALIKAGQSPAPGLNASGRPDQPRTFDLNGLNQLSQNAFYNHYAIDAKAGETIYIQSYPNQAPTGTDSARCIGQGTALYNSYYSYGVFMNDGPGFVCGTYFEYKFPADGRYRFNIRFKNTGGNARAVILPAT